MFYKAVVLGLWLSCIADALLKSHAVALGLTTCSGTLLPCPDALKIPHVPSTLTPHIPFLYRLSWTHKAVSQAVLPWQTADTNITFWWPDLM